MLMVPPAPSPQTALAAMKLVILPQRAHQRFVPAKMARTSRYTLFLPTVSLSLPHKGWKPVLVIMKDVVSQLALSAASKYEVMTGCEEAIRVVSKQAMK